MSRTHFVLLFEGRTGSSFLIDSLQSHPEIEATGESLVRLTAEEQVQWITSFFQQETPDHIKALGFKTKLRNIEDQENFKQLLQKFDVKVIHMQRNNLVKLAISRINARRLFDQKKQWNLAKGQEKLPPFELSLDDFKEALEFKTTLNSNLTKFIKTLEAPLLSITYEELIASNEIIFKKVQEFIGVTFHPLTSNVAKNTDDNIRNVITNYDEIKAHYKGTAFESEFE